MCVGAKNTLFAFEGPPAIFPGRIATTGAPHSVVAQSFDDHLNAICMHMIAMPQQRLTCDLYETMAEFGFKVRGYKGRASSKSAHRL